MNALNIFTSDIWTLILNFVPKDTLPVCSLVSKDLLVLVKKNQIVRESVNRTQIDLCYWNQLVW